MELAVVGSAKGFAIFCFLADDVGGSALGFRLTLSVASVGLSRRRMRTGRA